MVDGARDTEGRARPASAEPPIELRRIVHHARSIEVESAVDDPTLAVGDPAGPGIERPHPVAGRNHVPQVEVDAAYSLRRGVRITVVEERDHLCWVIRHTSKVRERSEEHTSELQSLMRISYAVFCLKKKKTNTYQNNKNHKQT